MIALNNSTLSETVYLLNKSWRTVNRTWGALCISVSKMIVFAQSCTEGKLVEHILGGIITDGAQGWPPSSSSDCPVGPQHM